VSNDFTLDDFRAQLAHLDSAGGVHHFLRRMPGMSEMVEEGYDPEDSFRRIRAIIDALTPDERREPDLIAPADYRRIAAVAAVAPADVGRFLHQFAEVRDLMRQMARMSLWQRIKFMWSWRMPPDVP
jgi:signal recognition particle subunit SRP54